jgi:regulator of telomere elongation helicase 1
MFNAASRRSRPKASNEGGADAASAASSSGDSKSNIKARSSTTPPTTVEIENIQIHFPFKPYDVQTKYMASVIKALNKKEHALLESPTGTGKTLCLLCSTLAWQQQHKGKLKTQPSQQTQQSQQTIMSQTMTQPNENEAAKPPTNKAPTIIYASRTHSQLSQVVRELRNTRYRPKHAILGSRDHMCIHPKVNPTIAKAKGTVNANDIKSSCDVNHGCNKLNKERKCVYRNNLDDSSGKGSGSSSSTNFGPGHEQPILDMEDLVSMGKQQKICPFYHTRSLIKDAEIIFLPYNYLFDPDARSTTLAEVDFANAVLIFDEAHNLEEFASESSSFDLTSADIAGCVGEVQRALQYLEVNPDMGNAGLKDNMLRLKSIFLRFEQYLLEGIAQPRAGQKIASDGAASHPGEFIFDLLKEGGGITHKNNGIFISFVREVSEFIMEFKGNTSSATPKLDHFVACTKKVFGTGTNLLALARSKSYRVHVSAKSNDGGGFAGGRTISYWCFAPSLAMRELTFLNVRSILITSGTLAPLPSFSMELGMKFDVQLENDHVIQPDQICVRVLGKGVSGKELSSKFGRRDEPEYITELGNSLASLCTHIPAGVLLFFPSYSSMQTCVEKWGGPSSERFSGGRQSGGRGGAFFAARKKVTNPKYSFPQTPVHFLAQGAESSTPWRRLLSKKAIVLEPRSTSDLNDAIAEFKKFLSLPKSNGCILMGVCRGKISEGIDFSDDMCRAVIVTGLPFAPFFDPKVKLKRDFLDAARLSERAKPSDVGGFGDKTATNHALPAPTTLSGGEWYNQQAHRAVNQALGRVIRHRHDYGAVILLDHRFAETRNRDGLSKWVRPHLREETFGSTTRALVQFFKDSKAKAEKAKAIASHPLEMNQRQNSIALKYEDNEEEQQVSKIVAIKRSESDTNDGFVSQDQILGEIDTTSARHNYIDMLPSNSSVKEENGSHTAAAPSFASIYSKNKSLSLPSHQSSIQVNTSTWSGLAKKPSADVSSQTSRRGATKQNSEPSRKSNETAKLQAKKFFDEVKLTLENEDLMEVQRLVVAMKGYGDAKDSAKYLETTKDLIKLLVSNALKHGDGKCIRLIRLLFPLLPVKFRYKAEQIAAILAFDGSELRRQCKQLLTDGKMLSEEFASVKKIVLTMIFDQQVSYNSKIDTSNDRMILEDAQKVLTVLTQQDVNMQSFLDLLPDRHLQKVTSLAIEMKKSRAIVDAKQRSSNFKGEDCVNTALFRRNAEATSVRVPKQLEALEDSEAEKNLTQALQQGISVNREKMDRFNRETIDRIAALKKQPDTKPKHINPYASKTANPYAMKSAKPLKESAKRNLPTVSSAGAARKRPFHGVDATSSSTANDVLQVLDRVKADGFVHGKTKTDRINGKINANVPKGFSCMICYNYPEEARAFLFFCYDFILHIIFSN